jgi:hypothetical protein
MPDAGLQPGSAASPARQAGISVPPKKPEPIIANRELFYGGFFGLITVVTTVVVMRLNRRWQKDQVQTVVIGGLTAVVLMAVGVPGVRKLATYAPVVVTLMPYAAIAAWMCLFWPHGQRFSVHS